jgi:hypothetical protein
VNHVLWLVALHAAGGLVLAAAGVAKVARPGATAAALRALGLPAHPVAARALGTGEVVIGVAGAVAGASWVAWVVAAEWLALGIAAIVLSRRPNVPCGCFGEDSPAPVGAGHVAVDAAFLAVAVAVASGAEGGLADAVAAGRGGWVLVGAQITLVAVLVRALLTDLPALRAAAVPV